MVRVGARAPRSGGRAPSGVQGQRPWSVDPGGGPSLWLADTVDSQWLCVGDTQ